MASNSTFEVGIIGAGIMGEALLVAISKAGIAVASIAIADKRSDRVAELQKKYGCSISSPSEIALHAKNILLVVKPQDMNSLLEEIGKTISSSQRVVSFAAGKKTSLIEEHLLEGVPVLRVMPNTPMSVGVGASAISGGKNVSSSDINAVEDLLRASGKTIVVDESLQDAVTATSGSGPAYFFRFVEAMIQGAKDLGLSESDAKTLVIQTITGAAAMLNVEGASPSTLRENVTSPNGTTFAALQSFESMDFEGIIKKAMTAARDRSRELS
ncbi:MAG: pyrroline-5-carboxylate reductase [Actinomycetota bacterium]